MDKNNISVRWGYLAMGVIAMLFAGVLYAWSILKAPLAAEFGWGASELALNFTLAMTFFLHWWVAGSVAVGTYGAQNCAYNIRSIICGRLYSDCTFA